MPPSGAYLARRVAAFGLKNDASADAASLSPLDSIEFMGTIRNQRLSGIAQAMYEQGALALTTEQAARLREIQRDAMAGCLIVERILLRLADAFEDAAIDFIVIKGPAIAHTFYPEPSWRPFGDLDLLVRTEDFKRACDVLRANDFIRSLPEPRPGFDVRFGKAALHVNSDGSQVDLHRTLVVGPFGLWIDLDALFTRTVEMEIAGRKLRRLDDSVSFLHTCIHATLGWRPPLMLPVRDVAQLVSTADIEWADVERLARSWRLEAVLQHSTRTMAERLELPVPSALVRVYERAKPTRRDLRVLSAYTTSDRTRGMTALRTFAAIPRLRDKLRYAAFLLVPSRRFLAARAGEQGKASYLRRWGRPIRWLVGGSR